MAERLLFVFRPGYRPFNATACGKVYPAEKLPRRQHRPALEACRQEIGEPAGKAKARLGWNLVRARQRRVAAPADLQTAEQIGLGARHAVENGRAKPLAAEDLRVRMKAQAGAAAIMHGTRFQERGTGPAAAVGLAPKTPIAGHLDLQRIGQRIDDRHPDAVQAACGSIGIATELAAGVQGCQDDLERRFVRETRMWIDRDAAPVVADGEPIIGGKLDLDPVGMTRDRLVHRIVEHLGGKMMQAALVGAADIHPGTATDRLQPFEDLDVLRRVAVGEFRRRLVEEIGHRPNIRDRERCASSIRCVTWSGVTRYWNGRSEPSPTARAFRCHRPARGELGPGVRAATR